MITSKSNELVKQCIQIKQKKYSKLLGLCFVESVKLVKELCQKGLIDLVLVVQGKEDEVKYLNNIKVEIISRQIAEYIADSVTTDGVFGISKIPNGIDTTFKRCLILDRIQDPANLGAIIRSACAFGYNTIFSISSVYPYTFKSIRSSMGQIFNVNFVDVTIEELIKIKENNDISFIVADMDGVDISTVSIPKNDNIAIVIGNEGQGVDEKLISISDITASIPMKNSVESLNASVSAGIVMYLLK